MNQSSLASTDLILAVPGAEQMRAMPRRYVREAYEKGEIEPSQLVWSAEDSAWRPIQELPHLLEKTKMLLPTPEARSEEETAKPVSVTPVVKVVASPTVVKVAKAVAQPVVAAPSVPAKPEKTYKRRKVTERGVSYLRLVAFLSFLVLASFIGVNYFMVDQPFQDALQENGLDANIVTHAHLGGFFQRDVVIIHLLPGSAVTEGNLLKTLSILARSTPLPPGMTDPFKMVALSPQWDTQYLIPSDAWHKLGDPMNKSTDDQKIVLLVNSLRDLSGSPLLLSDENKANLDKPDFSLTEREKNVWKKVVATFVPNT